MYNQIPFLGVFFLGEPFFNGVILTGTGSFFFEALTFSSAFFAFGFDLSLPSFFSLSFVFLGDSDFFGDDSTFFFFFGGCNITKGKKRNYYNFPIVFCLKEKNSDNNMIILKGLFMVCFFFLTRSTCAGWKESQFYSLPFGQAVPSMY